MDWDVQTVSGWLKEEGEGRLEELWRMADACRRECVGDSVHLRGLVEVSSFCRRSCWYCGLRSPRAIPRYRMSDDEVVACALLASRLGYGTLVLQSGEDPAFGAERVAALVRRVVAESGLAVTLSLGERDDRELALWKEAGADRYLLRFETSSRALYDSIHPPIPGRGGDRFAILKALRGMGYETGSGVMVGIPGQTHEDLARDILLFRDLDIDMIGVGPFLPHPDTPLGDGSRIGRSVPGQVPGSSELATCKAVALARLVQPYANIPATTALSTISPASGRAAGLSRGANIVMPNLTPVEYSRMYEIYPAKSHPAEPPEVSHARIAEMVRGLGRQVGAGRGDSPNWAMRKAGAPTRRCGQGWQRAEHPENGTVSGTSVNDNSGS